ncbi:MAG: type II secretion system protein [Planctomycetota bacterium]|jgi:type II secretory pathway pseudopilin PulG
MSKRTANKGFTLIEIIMGVTCSIILILGMGSILMLQFQGLNESEDFREASARVDLIRHLTFDGRTGSGITFPATQGANGIYTSYSSTILGSSVTGHRVIFTAADYDPVTEVTTPTDVRWESQTTDLGDPSNSDYLTDNVTLVVARFIEDLSATGGTSDPVVTTPSHWILRFQEHNIDQFLVTREATEDTFLVQIKTHEGDEDADIQLAVTLRNVTN